MQIGELSRRCGVSARMLRYYERQGLLRPDRTPAGYRQYHRADVVAVRRIVRLNRAGLTLTMIKRLLPCAHPTGAGFSPCPEFTDGVRRQLAEIDQRIAALTDSRRLLRSYLAEAETVPRAATRP
ncbi:MerR family transcriptional regulator [Rhodopseudomonas palustris]|nr:MULTISPECIES: MerR family transcriptional regulator [Rhodopseudomonas]KPF96561.1 MerR family transcriptional regulator [Rhodopseudomonas sp. AAP120]MCP9628199.1 MerR family transcriptional regulator [Rhodopseudomonas palustris]